MQRTQIFMNFHVDGGSRYENKGSRTQRNRIASHGAEIDKPLVDRSKSQKSYTGEKLERSIHINLPLPGPIPVFDLLSLLR